MLTSGLKILPVANPCVRSLLARNERQGACKQGAIGEDPPGPQGAGSPAQQAQLQRLAVCSYSSPGGPGPLSCGRTPPPSTPVRICPWPGPAHTLCAPSPVSSPHAAAGRV